MRILLIARHYPPAVSGGAKRPFLLANALREIGVEVRVCAPSLPRGQLGWVVPHPNRDPSTSARALRFDLRAIARDLLLWPDPDIRWCLRAAHTVIKDGWRPDWVISTSPPESIHVAGQHIARATRAKWMADFRDLWLEAPHRHERLRLHRRVGEHIFAKRLLPRADLVTAVDPIVAAEATRLGARNVHVLSHFVPDDRPVPANLPKDTLNVVHAGSISLSDPDASITDLLSPFRAAHAGNPALRLHLVGRLTDAERWAVERSPAACAIRIWGIVPLDEALAIMAAADALVLVASGKMHVPPSKITDYLMFNVPVIACGDGPWRKDARLHAGNPIEAMLRLRRGDTCTTAEAPRNASEAAASLLQMMRDVDRAAP